jgi:hypothetical protein
MFVGDYCLTLEIDTNLGLFVLTTNYPRLNKRLTVRLIATIEIDPSFGIYKTGKDQPQPKLPIRDLQEFIHKLLINSDIERLVYRNDLVTREIIYKYRNQEKRKTTKD